MSIAEDKSPVGEAELQAIIQSQQDKISHLQQQMDRMIELLLIAQRAPFGPSGEKDIYVSPDQITYFDEANGIFAILSAGLTAKANMQIDFGSNNTIYIYICIYIGQKRKEKS